LLDQVTATDTHPAASPALLALYDDVQRKLRKLEAAKASPGANTRSIPSSESSRRAIERLTVSEHQLHDEIVGAGETSDPEMFSHTLTLKSLQDALPERHAVLLEYWTGDTASFAWSITRTSIRSFRLPAASELTRQCLGYRKVVLSAVSTDPTLTAERRAALRTAQDAELRRLGAQLSKTLLPRDLIVPGTTMVFLVSDGPIESLPFAALPAVSGVHGRSIDFLREPSATIFSILETHPVTAHPMRVAVFAGELASANGVGSEVRFSSEDDARNRPPQFAALPFAGDEAMMIRATRGAESTRCVLRTLVS
jgi:hypothetical protein